MNKKIAYLSGFVGLVIILLISFITLQQSHKPEKVIKKFEDAVKQKDTKVLKEIIIPDNKKAVVEKGTLTALINYLNANHNSYQVIKDSLNEQTKDKNYSASSEQISLIEDGKDMGIFPIYKLKAKTVALKVSGQNDEDKIAIYVKGLDESLDKMKEKESYGPLLPGEYKLETAVKNQLGVFKQEEKIDVWGNPQVTVLVDPEKLARENDAVNEDIMQSTVIFNENLSKFSTSGLDAESFTNGTERFKEDLAGGEDYFQLVKTEIDEIQSQYLGAVINQDEMDISYFDGQWTADVEAIVEYNEKAKAKGTEKFQDLSSKTLVKYSLIYDKKQNKWLIDSIENTLSDGSEADYWEKKKELKEKDPAVNTWNGKGTSI